MFGAKDPYQRSLFTRYGIAVASVSLTLAAKICMAPYVEGRGSFLLFAVPVALTALYGGFWPAVFASVLTVLQVDEFILTDTNPSTMNGLRISFFMLESLFVAGVIESLHSLRRASRDLARENRKLFEQAASANKDKDEFLARVSHDLRAPISSILSWVTMIRGGKLPPEQVARGIEVIDRNIRMQNRLIEDLLDVSRATSGKLSIVRADVHLSEILSDVVETVRTEAASKGIRLDLSVAPGIPRLAADGVRLKQVIWNLLGNALKFTPSGGKVSIEAASSGACATITVRDTGAGIAPEFMPHLFDAFCQENSGVMSKGGLGLGLAISRHIVDLHGGRIEVESAGKGLGATFRVHLPINAPPRVAGASGRMVPATV